MLVNLFKATQTSWKYADNNGNSSYQLVRSGMKNECQNKAQQKGSAHSKLTRHGFQQRKNSFRSKDNIQNKSCRK